MMKMFLRTVYVFLIVLIGLSVYQTSNSNRSKLFYEEEVLTYLKEGNEKDYIESMMVLAKVGKYRIDPIIKYVSNDEDYKFTLNIYHIEKEIKGITYYGIVPFINDFQSNQYGNILKDPAVFVENHDTVGLELRINTTISNTFVINPLSPQYLRDTSLNSVHAKGGIFEPLFMESNNDSKEFKWFQGDVNHLSFEEITSFEFSILDGTLDVKNPKKTVFAKINVSDEPRFNELVEFKKDSNDNLVADGLGKSKSDYVELTDDYLESNNINIKETNFDVLNKYNSLVTRSMIIFSVLALLSTFLIFFLRPLKEMLDRKKALKKTNK